MSQCMGFNAPFYDAANALTQFCQAQCNVGTGAGSCLASADGCCVPYTQDPDCVVVARYNGPANGDDSAVAIASDSTGNVYVTGGSPGNGTSYDYATVAYASDLSERWVARYDGPDHVNDQAYAIATDGSGHVYVTGFSVATGTADYFTVAYDSSTGATLWEARYDGPGHGDDRAYAIAIDAAGIVYVTGASAGSGTGYDYATIAYDPGTGSALWVSRYQGPGDDGAAALAIDSSGHVCVTGSSPGTGSIDYVTIAYDPSTGGEVWISRYDGGLDDGPRAIATDSSGHVYVTGLSMGSGTAFDYATVAYDAGNGSEVWVSRYDGPAGGIDEARAIATDSSGHVYVTGPSDGTASGPDYATVAYDAGNGSEVWVARYNGTGNGDDRAYAIATDTSGHVYVTGRSLASETGYDYATVAYDSGSGNELWVARYNGPGNGDDYAHAMVTASGHVYVTGQSLGSGTGYDYATVRY